MESDLEDIMDTWTTAEVEEADRLYQKLLGLVTDLPPFPALMIAMLKIALADAQRMALRGMLEMNKR